MGTVYKARQTRLTKIVALKVLPKDRTTDPQVVTAAEIATALGTNKRTVQRYLNVLVQEIVPCNEKPCNRRGPCRPDRRRQVTLRPAEFAAKYGGRTTLRKSG